MDEGSSKSLTLYTRHACALCEYLALALDLMAARFHFEYTKVDIDADPALTRRYGLRVPVLLDGETEICAGACDPSTVEAYLTGCRRSPL